MHRSFIPLAALALLAAPVCAWDADDPWAIAGAQAIKRARQLSQETTGSARNVILFIGDGMGVSTVTAARIFEGQLRGQSGEENLLSFERFPHVALAKTYNTNQQVADSAGTMTALITGVKTKAGVLSIDDDVVRGDVSSVAGNELRTLLEHAEERGLATGVVTTARLTHATPAAAYAHSPERDWEVDTQLPPEAREAGFPDIARQLVEFSAGDGLEVAMGGGRLNFLPHSVPDPEDRTKLGRRGDGRNLTFEWLRQPRSAYVWNRAQLAALDAGRVEHLLGLFEASHMQFEADREHDVAGEPSLSEMTARALEILAKNPQGFVLVVEGGRIDDGHHLGNAYRALTDTVELARAVETALSRTDPRETLIIVTADHSHVLTIAGYPTRGHDILGKIVPNDRRGMVSSKPSSDAEGLPYTTLGYQNGPGYRKERPDLSTVDTSARDYRQAAATPLDRETHGGEDVAIYATGPGAQLVHGIQEQSYVYHVMAESLGWNRRPPGRVWRIPSWLVRRVEDPD